jgi:hypothetical protein
MGRTMKATELTGVDRYGVPFPAFWVLEPSAIIAPSYRYHPTREHLLCP